MNIQSRCALLLVAGMMLAVGHAAMAAAPNPLTIHSFCAQRSHGVCLDGSNAAIAGLVRGPQGFYYGFTYYGGIQAKGHGNGGGVVYRIDGRTGSFSVLYQFDPVLDGYGPTSLQVGSDGNLYGTLGGSLHGLGCVFRLSLTGAFTLVHAFAPGEIGGALLPLTEDAQGNWYGVAFGGGADHGEIYKISSDGSFTLMHAFDGSNSDGAYPDARLLLASDGNFYGTTTIVNSGTIFRMTPDGTVTNLHTFDSTINDGYQPGALTTGADGALYGQTLFGAENGDGVIFRITLDGNYSVLYEFVDRNGGDPNFPFTLMPDGNLYGTRYAGGDNDQGMIFRFTTSGDFTHLYSFAPGIGGNGPASSLMQGLDHALYGITAAGGRAGHGVVFRYVPPATQ